MELADDSEEAAVVAGRICCQYDEKLLCLKAAGNMRQLCDC